MRDPMDLPPRPPMDEEGAGPEGMGGRQPPRQHEILINRITGSDLAAIPDVGPDAAAAIIAYRDQNGPFTTCGDVAKVPNLSIEVLKAIAQSCSPQ